MSEPVRYEEHGTVAVITLDRADARNALTTEMLEGICAALERAEADPAIRAVALTGGPAVFASGADVRELRELTPAGYLRSARSAAWQRIGLLTKPAVAGVAGYVLGGGAELALTCDLVVAADTATFGQPEVRLGLIPGAGGTQRWARACGRYRAAELVLTADTLDAWTAQACGMVAEVVPAARLVAATIARAQRMAAFSPVATRLGRAALRSAEELPISGALAHERSLLATLLSTDDHVEGINAFLEKRAPSFEGR